MTTDPVARFLRARGCPEEVVTGGLVGLIEGWEHTAHQVQRGYPLGLDDYLNDLDARQLIEDLVTEVPGTAPDFMLKRIEAADLSMQEAVQPVEECLWGEALADREGWTPEENWWYFSLPKNPGQQMTDELENP